MLRTETPELTAYKKWIRSIAISALEPHVQELLDIPIKALSEKQKCMKRYYQQRIGMVVAHFSRRYPPKRSNHYIK